MQRTLRESTRRGNVLFIVCALAGILLTMVMVLHYQDSVTRAAVTTAEGDLEAREVARFELGRSIGRTQADIPTWLVVRSSSTLDVSPRVGPFAAAPLFDGGANGSLIDLWSLGKASFNKNISTSPGTAWFDFTPRAGFSGFGFSHSRYLGAASEYSNFAVVAGGAVKVSGTLASWANPQGGRDTSSGVPADVDAGNGVDIGGYPYGEAWCRGGKVKANADRWLGLAHWGAPTNPLRVSDLTQQCTAAMSTLSVGAADKTSFFNAPASSVQDVYDGISGCPYLNGEKNIVQVISLQRANNFPMGVIVTMESLAKGFGVYQVVIDTPFSPDGGDSSFFEGLEWVIDKWNELISQIRHIDDAIDWLEEQIDKSPDWNPLKPVWKKSLDLMREVADIAITAFSAFANAVMIGPVTVMIFSKKDPPRTRWEENGLGLSPLGRQYWAYREIYLNLVESLWKLPQRIVAMLDALMAVLTKGAFARINDVFDMSNKLNLYWIGPSGTYDGIVLGANAIDLPMTLNVPRNRTLRLRTSVTVRGDVWIARGASLVVDRDLSVKAASSAVNGTGRVFLEDGATLVVHGNFTCEGTPRGGSVVVGGTVKSVHPITSGILCGGTAEIPYGTRSGFSWDDEAYSHSDLTHNLLQPLSRGYAANLAKVDGPLHPRMPSIARYTATFQIITKPPMVLPGPVKQQSRMPLVVYGFSLLSSATLNFVLGENLLTQTDWWYKENVVPMSLKAEADALRNLPDRISARAPLDESKVGDFLKKTKALVDSDAQDRVIYIARWFVWQRYLQMAATYGKDFLNGYLKGIKYPTIPPGVPLLPNSIFPDTQKAINNYADAVKKAAPDSSDISSKLKFFWDRYQTVSLPTQLSDEQVRNECGGLLIYTGRDLKIGYLSGNPVGTQACALAAGLFVSRGAIRINAQSVVGALRSENGDVTVDGNLYFYPPFTAASLYAPPADNDSWLDRGMRSKYGGDDKRAPESRCLPVGGSPLRVSAWEYTP